MKYWLGLGPYYKSWNTTARSLEIKNNLNTIIRNIFRDDWFMLTEYGKMIINKLLFFSSKTANCKVTKRCIVFQ